MSKQTAENLTSVEFKAVTTPSGKKAYEAFVAIWRNGPSGNVAICSPTLEKLETTWQRITGTELNKELTQIVWIVEAAKP